MILQVNDYYLVRIPGDMCNTLTEVCEAAITEAREKTRIYAIPAEWTARVIKGEIGDWEVTVKVRRRRNKPA